MQPAARHKTSQDRCRSEPWWPVPWSRWPVPSSWLPCWCFRCAGAFSSFPGLSTVRALWGRPW